MLSCKKATMLIEKKQVVPLTAIEGFQLNLHSSMCKACKAYAQQSNIIDKVIQKFHEKPTAKTEKKLSEQTKNKIIDQINK